MSFCIRIKVGESRNGRIRKASFFTGHLYDIGMPDDISGY